jgi:hypothetical protein
MGLRTTSLDLLYNLYNIREPSHKACDTIDGMLAFDIVAIEYPAQ